MSDFYDDPDNKRQALRNSSIVMHSQVQHLQDPFSELIVARYHPMKSLAGTLNDPLVQFFT